MLSIRGEVFEDISESKDLACISPYSLILFCGKVLWEEDSRGESTRLAKFPKEKMRNSELLQIINCLR